MKTGELKRKFEEVFGGGSDPKAYRAPGRVNLIGEHTDYNDGLVLPIAIDLSTYGVIGRSGGEKVRLYSENLGRLEEFTLEEASQRQKDWSDYVRGILTGLGELTDSLQGFDLYINSEVPVGSGLASSAALEIVTAIGVKEEFHLKELEDLELIELCQRAENQFVGANTGIMDQYVSYFGRKGAALLIDTSNPSHCSTNLDLEGYCLLVLDTTVSHTHGDNAYNKRREECAKALRILNDARSGGEFNSLSRVSREELEELGNQLPKTLRKRAKHVVEENERVEETAKSLARGDVKRAGELFFASHASLRDLYEVSSPELDFLVDFAEREGIPGARMTGGGFGGSTVHLVPAGRLQEYLSKSKREFEGEFGVTPKGFVVSPSDGARAEPTPPS